MGALSSSATLVSTDTAPSAFGFRSVSGVLGSASASFAGVEGSASGRVALMLAMNGIFTVSVSEANVVFTI